MSTVCTSVYVPLNGPDTVEKLDASRLSARPWGQPSTFTAKTRGSHPVLRVQQCFFIRVAFQVGLLLPVRLLQMGWPGHDVYTPLMACVIVKYVIRVTMMASSSPPVTVARSCGRPHGQCKFQLEISESTD
jgi:hypothetical protein